MEDNSKTMALPQEQIERLQEVIDIAKKHHAGLQELLKKQMEFAAGSMDAATAIYAIVDPIIDPDGNLAKAKAEAEEWKIKFQQVEDDLASKRRFKDNREQAFDQMVSIIGCYVSPLAELMASRLDDMASADWYLCKELLPHLEKIADIAAKEHPIPDEDEDEEDQPEGETIAVRVV